MHLSLSLFSNCSSETCLSMSRWSVSKWGANLLIYTTLARVGVSFHWHNWILLLGGYNHLYYIPRPLWYILGPTSSFAYYNYIMTNPQKGIWSFYNSQHDQSTMGIDPMNNISNNNKNTLCSYIISTSSWEKCTPLLGASLLGFASTLLCARFSGGEGLSLEEYSKGFGWVLFPCWEGFPRILLVFLCMVLLLVILVARTFTDMVKC